MTDFKSLVGVFFELIQLAIPVVASLALFSFFLGLVKFIKSAGEGEIKEGRDLMVWGTIALFVMFSIWGILRFAHNDADLGGASTFGLPFLPVSK